VESVKVIKLAREALGDGFLKNGAFADECTYCGRYEKAGHQEDCKIGIVIKAIEEYFEE
jgi:hypothetical protein